MCKVIQQIVLDAHFLLIENFVIFVGILIEILTWLIIIGVCHLIHFIAWYLTSMLPFQMSLILLWYVHIHDFQLLQLLLILKNPLLQFGLQSLLSLSVPNVFMLQLFSFTFKIDFHAMLHYLVLTQHWFFLSVPILNIVFQEVAQRWIVLTKLLELRILVFQSLFTFWMQELLQKTVILT